MKLFSVNVVVLVVNVLFTLLWFACLRQERTFSEQQRSVRELNLRQLVARHHEQMRSHEHKLLERKHQLMRCERFD